MFSAAAASSGPFHSAMLAAAASASTTWSITNSLPMRAAPAPATCAAGSGTGRREAGGEVAGARGDAGWRVAMGDAARGTFGASSSAAITPGTSSMMTMEGGPIMSSWPAATSYPPVSASTAAGTPSLPAVAPLAPPPRPPLPPSALPLSLLPPPRAAWPAAVSRSDGTAGANARRARATLTSTRSRGSLAAATRVCTPCSAYMESARPMRPYAPVESTALQRDRSITTAAGP